jgi:hypothetical protein
VVEIRPIKAHEIHLCVPFGEAFHAELHLAGEFIPECFVTNWLMFLASDHAVILGLWKDGALIGGLGGMLAPDLYDGRLYAQEFFWFIGKDHRSGTGALRLLRAFEQWATARHATELRMVHLVGEQADDLDAFYKKLGYATVEVGYRKPLMKD